MAQSEIEPAEVGLSGEEIVKDLAGRLAAELAKSCHLTGACAYGGYSGKVVAELQLVDLDITPVTATVTVGTLDPGRLSHRYEIEVGSVRPSEVRERSGAIVPSLERAVDGSAPGPAVPRKRWYTPRGSEPVAVK
jgi:hypothetical protein